MAHIKQKHSGLWTPESTHEKIDSQKMFIDNLNQHEMNYIDLIKRVHTKVDSINELKSIDVSSQDSIISDGTLILVIGVGIYYYNSKSTAVANEEEIIEPSTGSGRWLLAGGGGGNLVVDDADYGEDTDSDTGIVIKIKKLFNKKLKLNFFPLTTTKAVRDTTLNKTLYELLDVIPQVDDEEVIVESAELRDADTLGGRYTAEDLDAMPKSTAIEDYANVEPPTNDIDRLGGKYTANDIEQEFAKINSSLINLENDRFFFDFKDGQYGFNTSAERGADTFHPFSNAKELYEALKYSRLVTPDMTYKQMLSKLSEYFPDFDGNWYNAGSYDTAIFGQYAKSGDGSVTFRSNDIEVKAIVATNRSWANMSFLIKNPIPISSFTKLNVVYSSSCRLYDYYNHKIQINLRKTASTSSEILSTNNIEFGSGYEESGKDVTKTGTLSLNISAFNHTECYLEIIVKVIGGKDRTWQNCYIQKITLSD